MQTFLEAKETIFVLQENTYGPLFGLLYIEYGRKLAEKYIAKGESWLVSTNRKGKWKNYQNEMKVLQNSEYRAITRGTGIQCWTTMIFVHEDEFEIPRKYETIHSY